MSSPSAGLGTARQDNSTGSIGPACCPLGSFGDTTWWMMIRPVISTGSSSFRLECGEQFYTFNWSRWTPSWLWFLTANSSRKLRSAGSQSSGGFRVITHEMGLAPHDRFLHRPGGDDLYPIQIPGRGGPGPGSKRPVGMLTSKSVSRENSAWVASNFWPEMQGLDAPLLERISHFKTSGPGFHQCDLLIPASHTRTPFSGICLIGWTMY